MAELKDVVMFVMYMIKCPNKQCGAIMPATKYEIDGTAKGPSFCNTCSASFNVVKSKQNG